MSFLFFLAMTFGMAYWLSKSDDFDLITFLRSAIESAIDQRAESPARSRPAARPGNAPASRPATQPAPPAGGARDLRSLMDLEGRSPDQVRERIGPPMRTIARGDGVTVWVYQDGALIVYFYMDRASLKPPRT